MLFTNFHPATAAPRPQAPTRSEPRKFRTRTTPRRSTISSMCVASSALSRARILRSCGLSGLSTGNRDAVPSSLDSSGLTGMSASRMLSGSSSHMSSQVAVNFAPRFMRILGPRILIGHVAGHGKDVAILLQGTACCDARAAVFGCFHHYNADRHAADDPLANREVLGCRKRTQREF